MNTQETKLRRDTSQIEEPEFDEAYTAPRGSPRDSGSLKWQTRFLALRGS